MFFTFVFEWLAAGIVSVFVVGLIGLMVVGMLSALVGYDSKATKVAIIILIICGIIIAVFIHSFLDFSEDSSSVGSSRGSGAVSSHSCCICGDDAYSKYGADYWCVKHYYMAKAADGDPSP